VEDFLSGEEVSEKEASELINFEKSKFGFYPIMVGEQSYDGSGYLGFKGQKSAKHVAEMI
jgi:hypothetical protein